MFKKFHFFTFIFLFTSSMILGQEPGLQKIEELNKALEANPNDIETLVKLGIIYHDKGADDEDGAVKKAYEYLGRVLAIDPGHAAALAYHGSVLTLKGRDSWLPWKKMRYVEEGVDEMDKAVDLEPDNVDTRILRGVNGVHLPGFFRRLPISIKDFKYLREHPGFEHFPVQLKASIYYYSGVAAKKDKREEEAVVFFQKSVEFSPDSFEGREAQKTLSKLESK